MILLVKYTARGAAYVSLPGSKPLLGNSSANGGSSLNSLPSLPLRESVNGLKSRRPAIDNAVTISGLQKNENCIVFHEFSTNRNRNLVIVKPCDEAMCGWICVVTSGKVSVI